MVLHNNKWDRRAKTKYLKKHGIAPSKKAPAGAKGEPEANFQSKSGNDHEVTSHPPVNSLQDLNIDKQEDPEADTGDEHELQKNAAEQQEIEGYELPELEENPEEQELIRRHIAEQKKKYEEQTAAKRAQNPVFDATIFKQAEANAERSKLTQRVKRIGALAKSKTMVDLDSDSDFEDFMDELDEEESSSSASAAAKQLNRQRVRRADDHLATGSSSRDTVDKTKIDFLDQLLH